MPDKKEEEEIKFKIVKFAPVLVKSMYHYFISLQEITVGNEIPKTNIVIKKQSVNTDGSPRGTFKQIFMPFADVEDVLNYALDFAKELKN